MRREIKEIGGRAGEGLSSEKLSELSSVQTELLPSCPSYRFSFGFSINDGPWLTAAKFGLPIDLLSAQSGKRPDAMHRPAV